MGLSWAKTLIFLSLFELNSSKNRIQIIVLRGKSEDTFPAFIFWTILQYTENKLTKKTLNRKVTKLNPSIKCNRCLHGIRRRRRSYSIKGQIRTNLYCLRQNSVYSVTLADTYITVAKSQSSVTDFDRSEPQTNRWDVDMLAVLRDAKLNVLDERSDPAEITPLVKRMRSRKLKQTSYRRCWRWRVILRGLNFRLEMVLIC